MDNMSDMKGANEAQPVVAPDTNTPVTTDPTFTAPSETASTMSESQTSSSTPADGSANEHPKAKYWKPKPEPILGPDGQPLSKKQQKRLRKQQHFMEKKAEIKQEEKRKRKLKAQRRRDAVMAGLMPQKHKRSRLEQEHTGITIAIDMAFDDLMLDKEIKSMADQIKRCYACNKSATKIFHLALTSFGGQSKAEFIARANGHELWRNFDMHEKSLEEIWPSEEVPGKQIMERLAKIRAVASEKSEEMKRKVLAEKAAAAAAEAAEATTTNEVPVSKEQDTTNTSTTAETTSNGQEKANEESTLDIEALRALRLKHDEVLATVPAVKKIVYLSADSPNIISSLEPGTCYVLGGIVDKNRYPRLCQEKAEKLGLATAQLPISEYIKLSTRRVLTVNQVFEILAQFVETKDWKEAFLKVIPQRKLEDKKKIKRGTAEWEAKYGNRSEATSTASSVTGDSDDEDEELADEVDDEAVDDEENMAETNAQDDEEQNTKDKQ
ncbi:tRNA (guanine(9)-N(1))-methyltransferase [Actinomortierella wolfii]|nr:tRNA (guanine(9)-N(1))-methyltransferase [Actinomortierella wolfii]